MDLSEEKGSKVRSPRRTRSSIHCPKRWCKEFADTFFLGLPVLTAFHGAPLEPGWTIAPVPPAQGTAAAAASVWSGLHFTCRFLNELPLLL